MNAVNQITEDAATVLAAFKRPRGARRVKPMQAPALCRATGLPFSRVKAAIDALIAVGKLHPLRGRRYTLRAQAVERRRARLLDEALRLFRAGGAYSRKSLRPVLGVGTESVVRVLRKLHADGMITRNPYRMGRGAEAFYVASELAPAVWPKPAKSPRRRSGPRATRRTVMLQACAERACWAGDFVGVMTMNAASDALRRLMHEGLVVREYVATGRQGAPRAMYRAVTGAEGTGGA